MNTNQAEQWLLLEQSGELNAWQRWRLARCLQRHPELAAFREDLRRISELSRASGPVDAPGWQVPGSIRQAAAEQQTSAVAPPASPIGAWWRPALAAGLAALAITTAYVTLREPSVSTEITVSTQQVPIDDIDSQIDSLNNLLALSLDTVDATADTKNADDIARELLALEGLEI